MDIELGCFRVASNWESYKLVYGLKTTMSTLHVMAQMRTHTSRAVLLQLNNMKHFCALVGILTINMINFYFSFRDQRVQSRPR